MDSPTCDGNILDLFMSNRDCVSLVNVTDNLPSTDHLAIEFSMSISIPTQFHDQRTLYKPISMFFVKVYHTFLGML